MKTLVTLAAILALSMPLKAENWMKRLPDDTYVCNLSIPGSHDTGTGNGFPGITTSIYGPFGDRYARTQDISLEEQWNRGVRAFDLRPCIKDDYINVNHGIMPTNLRFDTALTFLRDKLRENPSEFAIIHLLHASDGDDNAANYGERLLQLLNRDDLKDFFVNFKNTLTVREMRGKVLILSRNQYADQPVGGFMHNWTGQIDWPAQTNGQITGAGGTVGRLYMQDFAETHAEGALDKKVAAVRQMLDYSTKHLATSPSNIVWIYNFASAYSKTSRLYIPFIVDQQVSSSDGYRDNASHTNAAIIDYLAAPDYKPGPIGIILADYVGVNTSNGYNTRGQELIDALIANNFRYLKDMYQVGEADATYRKPIDMSARIVNTCFNSNLLVGWDGNPFGAVNPKENAEHFNNEFRTSQVLTDLPNGVYAVGCKGFFRAGEAQEAYGHFLLKDRALRVARLFAEADGVQFSYPLDSPFTKSVSAARGVGREIAATNGTRNFFIPDDMISAEHYMHTLSAYDNVVFAAVNNHSLTVGVEKNATIGTDWCVFDDFTLTYYGNAVESYRLWMREMRKQKLSYTGVAVSKSYSAAYTAAFNATVSDAQSAIAAMQAVEIAANDIALNAELWAEYKEVAAEAQAVLGSNLYSSEAKDFLRTYIQSVYQRNIDELVLSNDELLRAIQEFRYYIEQTCNGGWTGIDGVSAESGTGDLSKSPVYTTDGRAISVPYRRGLYITRGRKVVVK